MSESSPQQGPQDIDAASNLQKALTDLLGTFEGQAAAYPRDIDPRSSAGIGSAMLSGAASGGLAESDPTARTVEEDIAMGTSPWLAHIRHNRRDAEHPLITGFCQDETGTLRPLYGTGNFKSERQVSPGFLQSYTSERHVAMLAGEFVSVQAPAVVRGEYWDVLPADLRRHFEQGEILVTTSQNLYEDRSGSPASTEQAADEDRYFLMYYYDIYGSGRTGVLMHIVDGELQPVTATVDEREYILELKGCGTRAGGFGGTHTRTEREIVTGGAEADQTMTELNRLADDRRPGAPKAVGGILFENPAIRGEYDGPYEQGYTIRLSPSTVRASYVEAGVYPDVQSPEMVSRVLDMHTTAFTEHMFGTPPKILNRSSHTENILLWGDGQYTFTDYSDHAAFEDPHYPNGRADPKEMLVSYMEMVEEIPGFRRANKAEFYARLSQQFAARGIRIELNPNDSFEDAAQKIWQDAMAYQVYKGRKGSGYTPDSMIEEHLHMLDSGGMTSIDRSSAEALETSVTKARQTLLAAVDTIAEQGVALPVWPDTNELKAIIRTAKFGQVAAIAGQIYHDYRDGNEHIDYDQTRPVREALAFYSVFKMLTTRVANEYFDHELDVLDNALHSCPAEEREAITATRDEIIQKRKHLETLTNTDIPALYDIIKDAESMRAFLQPQAYRRAS